MFLVVVFWFSYVYICADSCDNFGVFGMGLMEVIKFGIPIFAIINNLRIAVVFRLNDSNDYPEYLFYVSLTSIALSYILFGVFLDDFIDTTEKNLTTNLGFMLTIFTFLLTLGSLLSDKHCWDKSTNFVKARIVLSLCHLTLLIINPIIGILSSVFFTTTTLLWLSKNPDINLPEQA